ncbi:RsmB/NOP family class I SAM-dependent RNA methyltransferase [Humidisolicoccus flavus]|uniref:RsmB/NOP family class I SAM-dependent RNA methyltransferase n=1 Tax=Humidisolicoccus flavus TaxID=3111414 RepID=UPI00324314BD
MSNSNARSVALSVLLAVERDDAYANLLLPSKIAEARLSREDAALATELTYGTLRWRGQYDALIERASGRAIADVQLAVLSVLRMAIHQILRTRVPEHAAVFESIDALSPKAKGPRGFANAVLRNLGREGAEEALAAILAERSGDERLSIQYSHPTWIIRAFRRALEAEHAGEELEALLAADTDHPSVHLVALPGLAEPEELGDATTLSPLGRVLLSGDPGLIPAVRENRARVQDSGSQLAALLVASAPYTPEDGADAAEYWLDMCAGPGGKAALLAAIAARRGDRLEANEIGAARTQLVRRALAGITPTPRVVTGDGRRYGDRAAQFDRILLNAPCTGLGALRRRPEARWRKSPSDVAELAALQEELFEAAFTALKPGGVLAYVTCSPHLAETRAVVQRVHGRSPRMQLLDTGEVLRTIVPDAAPSPGTSVQLWPHRNETDAMFIQLVTKSKEAEKTA